MNNVDHARAVVAAAWEKLRAAERAVKDARDELDRAKLALDLAEQNRKSRVRRGFVRVV